MRIGTSYTFTVSVTGLICIKCVHVGSGGFAIQLLFITAVFSVVNLFPRHSLTLLA